MGYDYLTRERRRFSAAMILSVEVGIQRRTEGQMDFDFNFAFSAATAAVEEAAEVSRWADLLISSAILDESLRRFIRFQMRCNLDSSAIITNYLFLYMPPLLCQFSRFIVSNGDGIEELRFFEGGLGSATC